jgi:hypothetical protein
MSRREYRLALRIFERLKPLIAAAVWPRWLSLEAGLASVDAIGDLLGCALMLRSMLEEVRRMQHVAEFVCWLRQATSPGATFDADEQTAQRVRSYMQFLADYVLPRLKGRTPAELKTSGRGEGKNGGDEALQALERALNEYVHPNHGSHVLAVWPERAPAGRCLLEALVCAYETFVMLPWVVDEIDAVVPAPALNPLTEAPAVFARFRDEFLSLLPGPDHAPWIEFLERMVEVRATSDWQDDDQLATIRETADRLVGAASSVPVADGGGPNTNSTEWALWMSTGIELAILIGDYKYARLIARAVAFLVIHEPLPAAICARAAFEHHAIASVLGLKVLKNWQAAQDAVRSSRDPGSLIAIEEHIGRILAGSRGASQTTTWALAWLSRKPRDTVNIAAAAKGCGDALSGWYDLLSRTVHGYTCTGGDLLDSGGRAVSRSLEIRVANIIGILEQPLAILERTAAMAITIAEVQNAAVGDRDNLTEGLRFAAIPDALRLGRDVIGAGTESDPYRSVAFCQPYWGSRHTPQRRSRILLDRRLRQKGPMRASFNNLFGRPTSGRGVGEQSTQGIYILPLKLASVVIDWSSYFWPGSRPMLRAMKISGRSPLSL